MIPARWAVAAPADPRLTAVLASDLHIPATLAAILVQRGLAAPERAKAFLRPDLERLSDPHGWADMSRAVELIVAPCEAQSRSWSTATMTWTASAPRRCSPACSRASAAGPTRLCRTACATATIRARGLAEARRLGAGLIITCDCGITAVDAVRAARAAGIEVIVTDHHLRATSSPRLRGARPRRADCPSEEKDLCGSGVAFKLAQALVSALGVSPHLPLHFLDLVALATVADVVPLTGENRILVRHGLKLLAESHWTGVAGAGRDGGPRGQADQVGARRVSSWHRA